MLGPRHQDLLQAVDEALQGAAPRRGSCGACMSSQGQRSPAGGSRGPSRAPEISHPWRRTVPALSGGQEARWEGRMTRLHFPTRSAPGQAPLQESQPLTWPRGPSLLVSVALLPVGATGGRAAFPAWGSGAFLLCRPRCVSSSYSRRQDGFSSPGS